VHASRGERGQRDFGGLLLFGLFLFFFSSVDALFISKNLPLLKIKVLCGNKYGTTPLPLEITQKEFENVRKSVSNSGKIHVC